MKVILLKDVDGLGPLGAVKEVKEGYARNYLFPRELAVEATDRNVRALHGREQVAAQRELRERLSAEKMAAALEQAVVEIPARSGEGGRLFGSITAEDIAEALGARGFNVSKKQVELAEPIKQTGFFKVRVRVGRAMVAHVDINVSATK